MRSRVKGPRVRKAESHSRQTPLRTARARLQPPRDTPCAGSSSPCFYTWSRRSRERMCLCSPSAAERRFPGRPPASPTAWGSVPPRAGPVDARVGAPGQRDPQRGGDRCGAHESLDVVLSFWKCGLISSSWCQRVYTDVSGEEITGHPRG